jgi:hypothetical protein
MIDIDAPYSAAAEAPVSGGAGRAFLAGARLPNQATVHSLDVADGRLRWSTAVGDPRSTDIATSLPALRGDGGAWIAVHEFDHGVTLHGIDARGSPDARIALPDTYPLARAGDLGSKLMLRLAADDAAVIGSWSYRSVRDYGLIAYTPSGARLWSAPEWLLARAGRLSLSCPVPTRPPPGSAVIAPPEVLTLVARDAVSGAVLWRSSFDDASVCALASGSLYLIDRSGAFVDAREQAARVDARFLAGELAEAELDESWGRCIPRAPTRLRAFDAQSGQERWAIECGAQVLSVAASESGVGVLCHELSGALRLRMLSPAGTQRSDHLLHNAAGCNPLRQPNVDAALVSGDGCVIALTSESWSSHDWDGRLRQSGPVPAPCFGFEPRIVDRWLNVASAVMVAGRLVLRAGRRVWILPHP